MPRMCCRFQVNAEETPKLVAYVREVELSMSARHRKAVDGLDVCNLSKELSRRIHPYRKTSRESTTVLPHPMLLPRARRVVRILVFLYKNL